LGVTSKSILRKNYVIDFVANKACPALEGFVKQDANCEVCVGHLVRRQLRARLEIREKKAYLLIFQELRQNRMRPK
jgi:hypothetical protein